MSVWLHLSGAAYIFSFSQSGSYFNHRVPFNEETLNQVSRSKVKVVVQCKIIVGPYLSPWPSVDYCSLRDCLCIRVCNAIEFVLEKTHLTSSFWLKFIYLNLIHVLLELYQGLLVDKLNTASRYKIIEISEKNPCRTIFSLHGPHFTKWLPAVTLYQVSSSMSRS